MTDTALRGFIAHRNDSPHADHNQSKKAVQITASGQERCVSDDLLIVATWGRRGRRRKNIAALFLSNCCSAISMTDYVEIALKSDHESVSISHLPLLPEENEKKCLGFCLDH